MKIYSKYYGAILSGVLKPPYALLDIFIVFCGLFTCNAQTASFVLQTTRYLRQISRHQFFDIVKIIISLLTFDAPHFLEFPCRV